MSHPTLFPPDEGIESKPLRRRDDPETSRISAAETVVVLGVIHAFLIDVARSWQGDFTSRELAAEAFAVNATRDCETYRKRTRELARMGHFRETEKRVCKRTGKQAMAFEVVK